MAPYWANRSCDPFGARDEACVKGTYLQYAVQVESVSDITRTVQFAGSRNLRLVIRNTGHDYFGKSTGAGAIGLWMHKMNGFDAIDFNSSYYNGKAVRVAAGALSADTTAKAHQHGLAIVGGNCPSVGLAGGYTQGGGLGPLTSRYGLAADQVLEWNVVTVNGTLVKATPEQNTQLYWALSGGGGGTFGVVVSMTVKAYPEERTASANLTFSSAGVPAQTFFDILETFHSCLPTLSKAGGTAIYNIQQTGFALIPATLPGQGKDSLDSMLDPVITKLKSFNITYVYASIEANTYFDAYEKMNPPSETSYFQIGGRVLPQHALNDNYGQLMQSLKDILDYGAGIGGLSYHVPESGDGRFNNSVNPRLRSGALSLTIGTVWDDINWTLDIANQELMTEVLIPAVDRLDPTQRTSYLNEADFREQQWQEVFYGESYRKLLHVKQMYDFQNLLWGRTAVGSETWLERNDGKLCRSF
ncbi:FAD-binding domain-containing protein [Polyplosphaeria fusca]|uniref:FAD-binding domain-containing protein n=1 Tax=Polyplosphaeria fusca TaxID=682080 RepID=A0A9P4UTY8_9PLEO|nr:FAD-binding domain-containing protein [Polyplosphaeria fusca]